MRKVLRVLNVRTKKGDSVGPLFSFQEQAGVESFRIIQLRVLAHTRGIPVLLGIVTHASVADLTRSLQVVWQTAYI